MNRRQFLAGAGLLPLAGRSQSAESMAEGYRWDFEAPLFHLEKLSSTPVKVAAIDALRIGKKYLVRATSTDGATGIAIAKSPIEDYLPILTRRVIPYFKGKDARQLETLVDGVYTANYKLAGQAFYVPVAAVEMSLLDLLGRTAKKPVGALMGGIRRKEIAVYLSGSDRVNSAEKEVERFAKGVEQTGAKAVKFKIGGRMSRNADAYPGRTEEMMELARKHWGEGVTIYVDANGSYTAAKAIRLGRMMESLKIGFFEEPCPWEEVLETKQVADALSIPVAFGEQDSSLPHWRWMIQNKVMDIVQPDLNYNGGFIRAARVARMAEKAGMTVVNHNTETGPVAAKILHFASAIPNMGPYMEYAWDGDLKPESWYTPHFKVTNGMLKVPEGPGFGIEYDPDYLKKAVIVEG